MILLFDRPTTGGGLARALRALGREVSSDTTTDLESMRAVRQRVVELRPRAIIVARSWDDPAGAERDPERAFRVNTEGSIHVAAAALEVGAVAVLISTAEVYGQKGGPFGEGDDPAPAGVWARSRLMGEQYLTRATKNALVVRTGPILDDRLPELRWLLSQGPLEAATDEHVSPIDVEDLAAAIHVLLEKDARGLFHLGTGEEGPSRADFYGEAAAQLGLGPARVVKKTSSQLAARPPLGRSPTLLVEKARRLLDRPLRPWREAMARAAGVEPAAMIASEVPMAHKQDVRRVDKPWGHEIIWAHSDRYVGKILFVKAGERLSLQYHQKKDETVYVLSGKMVFEVGPKDQPREDLILKAGDAYRITPHTVHRMIALEDTTILEASTPELDDVVRLEDKYGRSGTSTP